MSSIVLCVICEAEYLLRQGRRNVRGFCPACRRCLNDMRRNSLIPAKRCKRCDSWFAPSRANQMFCDKFCFEHWRGPNRRHIRRAQLKRTDMTDAEVDSLRLLAKRCRLCKCSLTDKAHRPNSKHLDHILGLHVGGSHTRSNVRILCRTCNLARPKHCGDQHIQLGIWESMTLVSAAPKQPAKRTPTEFEIRRRRRRMVDRNSRMVTTIQPSKVYPPAPMLDVAVRTLHQSGLGQKAIARRLGTTRDRVRLSYQRMALTPHAYTNQYAIAA